MFGKKKGKKSIVDILADLQGLGQTAMQTNLKAIAEMEADRERLRLSDDQKQLLNHFWHTIDQVVIKKISASALVHQYSLSQENHQNYNSDLHVGMILNNLRTKDLFEDVGVGRLPNELVLTMKGIIAVRDLNPKISQFNLALRDFAKNKVAVVATVIGILSGIIGIYSFIQR